MRRTKVLIVPPAHVRFVFPSVILPDDQRADSLFHQQVNNPLADRVHVVIDPPVPLVRHALHALCGAGVTALSLEFCLALVVE
jgi:hypothetical protein